MNYNNSHVQEHWTCLPVVGFSLYVPYTLERSVQRSLCRSKRRRSWCRRCFEWNQITGEVSCMILMLDMTVRFQDRQNGLPGIDLGSYFACCRCLCCCRGKNLIWVDSKRSCTVDDIQVCCLKMNKAKSKKRNTLDVRFLLDLQNSQKLFTNFV